MRVLPRLEVFNGDRDSTPFTLASLEDDDGAFVSCYLDTRAGKRASITFLNQKAAQIRETLHGIDRFHFDSAVEMIRHAIASNWRAETGGVALFARGIAGDSQLVMLHSAAPVDNRLVYYSLPEVLPLIALHQREPAFGLLRIEGDRIQLFESRLGAEATRLCVVEAPWAGALGGLDNDLTEKDGGTPGSSVPQDAVWQFHKALGASSSPLFIAGSTGALCAAADWLPRRATERLVGTLAVSRGVGLEEVLERVSKQLSAICREESVRLADAVTDEDGLRKHSRLGYRSTLRALRCEDAEAVVIGDWDHPGLGLPREAAIEICFEALRRGVRVVLADSLSLRQAGGVGCLLRHRWEEAKTPSVEPSAGFDRVA